VREERYDYTLEEEGRHWVRVIKRYEQGLADYVIAYYVRGEEGTNIEIATWDCKHGFAHRDLRYLEEGDKRRKVRFPEKPLLQHYADALEDVHRNWPRYFAEYCERKVRK